jgi:hypothetical protein
LRVYGIGSTRAAASRKEDIVLIALLIVSAILGGIVAGITGIGALFWVVSIVLFVCGLPFTLIDGYIQDKIDYVQDREDYREIMREVAKDERMDRYLDKLDDLDEYDDDDYDDEPNIYIDNRQVHIHNNYTSERPRDEHGRFISVKKQK